MSSNEKFEREFEAFMNEEDSRLAALYRKLPQAEPDAKLDAAVRSMAHRALNPQLVATPRAQLHRRRARWLPAFGAAAGIVLAAGIAWRVETDRRSERNELGAPANDIITVRQLDVPPPPPAEAPLSPAPPPADSAPSVPATHADAGKAQSAAVSAFAEPSKPASAAVERQKSAKLSEQTENQPAPSGGAVGKVENAAKSLAPRAFPAAAPAQKRSSEMDAVDRKQIMAAGAWQNLHDRDTNESKDSAQSKSLDDKASAAAAISAGTPGTRPALAGPPPAAVMKSSVSVPTESATPRAESTPSASSSAAQAESAAVLQTAPPPPRPAQLAPMAPPPARESAAPAGPARADAAGHATHDESTPSAARVGGKEEAARVRSADPNAGLYPEHWLANIRSMLKEKRRDDALRSLGEFRRIYPDYHLPEDLRDLEKP
jgi:hypothetical protein